MQNASVLPPQPSPAPPPVLREVRGYFALYRWRMEGQDFFAAVFALALVGVVLWFILVTAIKRGVKEALSEHAERERSIGGR